MIPSKFFQGDSLIFSVDSYRDSQGRFISSPDWSLELFIRGNGNSFSHSTSTFDFSISSLLTKSIKPGKCYYQIVATSITGETVTVDQGPIEVLATYSGTTDSFDPRSQTEKDLSEVQSLIRKLISTGGTVQYRIGGRELRRYELTDLITLESRLKNRLAHEKTAEKIRNGEGNPNSKYVRFK